MPRRLKYPRRVIDTTGVEVVDRPEPTVDEMVELFRRMDTSARWHFRRRIARIFVTRPLKPAQESVTQSRPKTTNNLIGRVMRGEVGRAELRAMARERKDGS